MAYAISNSPYARFPNIGDQTTTRNSWRYDANTGESISDVRAAGFFTNAGAPTSGENSTGANIGMQVGDEVLVYVASGNLLYYNVVSLINTTTGAGTIVVATFS